MFQFISPLLTPNLIQWGMKTDFWWITWWMHVCWPTQQHVSVAVWYMWINSVSLDLDEVKMQVKIGTLGHHAQLICYSKSLEYIFHHVRKLSIFLWNIHRLPMFSVHLKQKPTKARWCGNLITMKLWLTVHGPLTLWCPSSLSLYDSGSSSEKTWFTDEPENTHLRTIQIKPVNSLTANQVNQYKSTSNLIPPIREVEDECWTPDRCRHLDSWTLSRLMLNVLGLEAGYFLICSH